MNFNQQAGFNSRRIGPEQEEAGDFGRPPRRTFPRGRRQWISRRQSSSECRILRNSLGDCPRDLADSMLQRMSEDFGYARAISGASVARDSLRSSNPAIRLRCVWILAGIIHCLQANCHDEGLARASVALAAVLSTSWSTLTVEPPLIICSIVAFSYWGMENIFKF